MMGMSLHGSSQQSSRTTFSLGGTPNKHNFHVKIEKAYGIMGFVRFIKGYYLLMITKRQKVAKIGYHDIYSIKDMKMIPLYKWTKSLKKEDELKYVEYFK